MNTINTDEKREPTALPLEPEELDETEVTEEIDDIDELDETYDIDDIDETDDAHPKVRAIEKYGEVRYCRVKTVSGQLHIMATKNIIGFCHNLTHRGAITQAILVEHECIEKNCPFFEKYADAPFWEKYDRKQKEKLKAKSHRRAVTEKQREKALHIERRDTEFKRTAAKKAAELGLIDFRITSIRDKKRYYIVCYVSDRPYNDFHRYLDISEELRRVYHKYFHLQHVRLPDGSFATSEDIRAFKKQKAGSVKVRLSVVEILCVHAQN